MSKWTSQSLVSQLTRVSAGKAGTAIIGIVTAALIAHEYGQQGLGIYALLRILPTAFVVLTDPGLSHSIPFLLTKRKVDPRQLLASCVLAYIPITLTQTLIWIGLNDIIRVRLLPTLTDNAVLVSALLAPIQSANLIAVNFLRTYGHVGKSNAIYLLNEVLALAFFAAWAASTPNNNPDTLTYILTLTSLIGLAVATRITLKETPKGTYKINRQAISEGMCYGAKSQLGNAFQILNYRLDHIFVGLFLSAELVATYFVATKAAEFFRFFTAAVVFVLEPRFASQKTLDAASKLRKLYWPVFFANFALLLVGLVIAPQLYPRIFGTWSQDAFTPLVILTIGLTASGANSLYGAYFLGQGLPAVTTKASAAGLVATLALSIVLIPTQGINGAAVTSTISYIVVTLFYAAAFRASIR